VHATYKYLLETAIFMPTLEGAKYAGVWDFRLARCIFFNGYFFPLATGMHQLQNVVEEAQI